MHQKSSSPDCFHNLERLKHYLSALRGLPNGYAKTLSILRKKILIVGPDGEMKKFPLRRKDDGWVELGPHGKRRGRRQKDFPGRFSLVSGESLDGFDGWRLVPFTPTNRATAEFHAQAREYREACGDIAPSLRPEYASMLVRPDNPHRRRTPELEDQVGTYLKKNSAERRAFLEMMKTDCHIHPSAG